MRFENTPNIVVYDAFKKAERYLALHNRIAVVFISNNFITKIVKDFLKKVIKTLEEEGFSHNKEIHYICIKDFTIEEVNDIYDSGKYDLVIEMKQGFKCVKDLENTSCFTDNKDVYNEEGKSKADIYCPLWWFINKDIEEYIKFYGLEDKKKINISL